MDRIELCDCYTVDGIEKVLVTKHRLFDILTRSRLSKAGSKMASEFARKVASEIADYHKRLNILKEKRCKR